jgi:hypothetical protein
MPADNIIKKEFGWLVICPVCKGEVMVYPDDWAAVTCVSGHWIRRKDGKVVNEVSK